jgi:hypothetical protein
VAGEGFTPVVESRFVVEKQVVCQKSAKHLEEAGALVLYATADQKAGNSERMMLPRS